MNNMLRKAPNKKRPRGFAPYKPQAKARQLIEDCKTILEEYRQAGLLPMTLRQLFYRLHVVFGYPKTELASDRLSETMNRARRAEMISMDDIRDDGFALPEAWWFDGEDDFWEYVRQLAEAFTLDRQLGQARRVIVWCEAGGMRPQLQEVCRPYGVRVASSGGFDSTTTKHKIGRMLAEIPTTVLHIGDYDPSGVHLYGSLDEDITKFANDYGGDVEFERIAVLSEHIEEYGLPVSPPKATDNREFDDTRTTQVEALDPRELAEIVKAAIEKHLDIERVNRMIEQGLPIRERLIQKLDSIVEDRK